MKNLTLIVIMAGLAGCSTTLPGTEIAGHPYRTDLDCERTEPLGEFDRKCDYPLLGARMDTSWLPSAGGPSGNAGTGF